MYGLDRNGLDTSAVSIRSVANPHRGEDRSKAPVTAETAALPQTPVGNPAGSDTGEKRPRQEASGFAYATKRVEVEKRKSKNPRPECRIQQIDAQEYEVV